MGEKSCLHCVHLAGLEMIDGVPVVYCDIPGDECSFTEAEKGIVIAHSGKDMVKGKQERDKVIREAIDEINNE